MDWIVLRDRARAAWPEVDVADDLFRSWIEERAIDDVARAADLYLACACANGDERALRAFEREVMGPEVASAVARIDGSPAFVDEVLQLLRQKLLVGGEARPRISDYAGRGPLSMWVRVAATRAAISLIRRRKDAAPDLELFDLPSPAPDPELEYVKRTCASEFRAAFEAALASLGVRERTLLRLSYLDGLTVDEVGRFFHVHRATAARWVARARELVLASVRSRLSARLRLSPSELDSLMRLVSNRLDVSLHQLLIEEPNP